MQIQVPQIDFEDLSIEQLPVSHRTPRFIAWFQGMMNGSIQWIDSNFMNYCYGNTTAPVWKLISTYNLNDEVNTYNGTFISTVNSNQHNDPNFTPNYSNTSGYSFVGTQVIYGYTTQEDGTITPNYYILKQIITPEDFNPDHWTALTGSVWYKISPSYIGAQERLQYSSQKLVMEYMLNRWFRTTFRQPVSYNDGTVSGKWYLPTSDIWIQTNNFDYSSFGVGIGPQALGSVSSSISIYGVSSTSFLTSSTTFTYTVWIPTALKVALGTSFLSIISSIVDKVNPLGTIYKILVY